VTGWKWRGAWRRHWDRLLRYVVPAILLAGVVAVMIADGGSGWGWATVVVALGLGACWLDVRRAREARRRRAGEDARRGNLRKV
jgi:Flp pilus assembly protein TadB